MNKLSHLLMGAAAGAAILSITPALAGGEAGKLVLRDLGAKYVGYTTTPGDNGSVNVSNAMFVQYMLPVDRKHAYPLVMIHGGGGQGTDWLQTPDGRDGWADYFVADGWDVYVVDRPGHGRSQSNPSCRDGKVGVANSTLISRLATSDASVWPGGTPTPTNPAVIGWTASSTTAPYCGDVVAAEKISALLDEIGPAVLLAHSAGGGSTFRVPELNPKKVVGIVAFEAALSNPVAPGFNNAAPVITSWKTEPALSSTFAPVDHGGCPMQGDKPSKLVNFAKLPIILVGSQNGLLNVPSGFATSKETFKVPDVLKCEASVWQQAGADASYVYLPDRGLKGGGHFAMAQLDNAKYAKVFIELATQVEKKAKK
jgi:pimeloyl-ACP methyl ester carboxylesterase